MRRWFPLFALLLLIVAQGRAAVAAPPPTDSAVPPLLLDALTKLSEDFDHWAYTETRTSTDPNGKPKGETVIRFDPSKRYAEQYMPLRIDGQPPTERQLGSYQKRGERRGDRLMRDEAAGKTPGPDLPRLHLGGDNSAIDLEHATIAGEADTAVTFSVPLRKDAYGTLPVEKIELLARVNKERRAFENVSLRVRESFRVKLLVKVKGGEASVDFGVVDPKFVPVMTSMSGEGTATVLFIKFGGSFDVKRTDFRRVKPYSERFGVKIGSLKALDF
jgi:hypothetical protein